MHASCFNLNISKSICISKFFSSILIEFVIARLECVHIVAYKLQILNLVWQRN